MNLIWFKDGRYLDSGRVNVHASDLGLNRGWALFEYLRTYNHEPFRLTDHLERYFSGAKSLLLEPPLDRSQMEKAIRRLITSNDRRIKGEIGIKIILTAGDSEDGIIPRGGPSLIMMALPAKAYPSWTYLRGISLLSTERERVLPGTKTTNYLSAMLALREAQAKGFYDALFLGRRGEVLESTRSNFFAFFGNELITPPPGGLLLGITRKMVFEIARKEKFKIRERRIFRSNLAEAREAFLTSSDKEIMPVVKIDNFMIGDGRIGSRTKLLMTLFKELTKNS